MDLQINGIGLTPLHLTLEDLPILHCNANSLCRPSWPFGTYEVSRDEDWDIRPGHFFPNHCIRLLSYRRVLDRARNLVEVTCTSEGMIQMILVHSMRSSSALIEGAIRSNDRR